ncbi:hypothetical protein I302_106803 [Kwoniella bestiolae CBS 10118]|uniref:Smr domain-containing protein n=1 Tax=Kwoniella bestiolae CBS 10118 TaxID=1296100 RepID=A0A1B9G0C8_9TREE|nr:hypothetical protein I302_05931 [Kwoniella bestiolae CBS 10118]OCF24471.1 hypothetical protein I302_05931 [Kwoniella bestiolae CBS 10118]
MTRKKPTPTSNEPIDPASLAAVLAADYPLIDPTLILAILSDYPSSDLSAKIPEIKDQLGILEATLVPDPDLPAEITEVEGESLTESTSQSGVDELSSKLDSLHTGSATTLSEGTEEFGDEVDLLRSLFPLTPENDLTSVLHSYPTLQEAIDHLLSLELIRNVEEEGQWPNEGDVKVLSEPESWEPSRSKKSKPKSKSKPSSRANSKPPSIESSPIIVSTPQFDNAAFPEPTSSHSRSSTNGSTTSAPSKKKKKDKITIPIVDTLQRQSTPTSRSRTSTAPSTRSASPARFNDRAGPTNNPWHTVTSLSSYLSDLLSQPSTHFSSYLHSPNYHSTYSAVLASLAKLPSQPFSENFEDDMSSRKILEDLFGLSLEPDGGDKKRDLEICVHAAGEDIATVMDLMDLLDEISDWSSDDDRDNDLFDPAKQPDYTINTNSTPLPSLPKAQTITLNLPPVQAIDMARSTSAGSTISNKSIDEHLPLKSSLPGKMTRPEKKVKPSKMKDEPLFGGAIREAKIREVPGSRSTFSALSSPMVLDAHELNPTSVPSSPKLGNKQLNGKQVHPQNWRTVSSASHSRSQSQSASSRTAARERKPTYEECLANAQLERARRETVIRAAGRNFRPNVTGVAGGGRAVKGVIAGHYASQALEAGQRARNWELQAARMRMNAQVADHNYHHNYQGNHPSSVNGNSSGRGNVKRNQSVDLHNYTISQALVLVNERLEEWWKVEKEIRLERWKIQEQGRFVIITGVGRHSVNNKGVLGPAVSGDLERKGWRVDRGDGERGYLVVSGR